jgi:N-acetylmuramoyl-L-alanine amidase
MKICIDPGHGMSNNTMGVYDPGAGHNEHGSKFEEAAIALRYGLSLKDVLRAQGTDVFMTRDDSQDHAPLRSRAGNAKAAGCDRYVSLHLNDVEDETAHGLEVLYGKPEHKALAERLLAALVAVTQLRDRGAKPRPELAVLKFKGPAVLVELGFIANDGDREKLLNPAMRDAICRSIAAVMTV